MDRFLHLIHLVVFFLFITSGPVSAKFQCEDLSVRNCAFAVSSSGERCVLEKYILKDGQIETKCQSSRIMAEGAVETIESEECVKACGLQKMSVGLSTDALLDKEITRKLCSYSCRNFCPNIIDLYTKLAAGEGNDLLNLCQSVLSRPRKLIQNSYYYSLSVDSADGNEKLSTAAEAPVNANYYTMNAQFQGLNSPGPSYESDQLGAPAAQPVPDMEGIRSSDVAVESPDAFSGILSHEQDGYRFNNDPQLIAPTPYPYIVH